MMQRLISIALVALSTTSAFTPASVRRSPLVRSRPRVQMSEVGEVAEVVEIAETPAAPAAAAAAPAADEAAEEVVEKAVPGSLGTKVLDEITAAKQATELAALSKTWKRARINREIEESKLLGFTRPAEISNGRAAMFFIVTGILTELFTGESIPSQVAIMLQTFGIIGLDN
mmetsp:Transcript_23734/g.54724  ORF Transcript_23734/g.54724 Transcript_23734/m.54724 type:complete len:172 (-) Transcript_23734:218-733(-)